MFSAATVVVYWSSKVFCTLDSQLMNRGLTGFQALHKQPEDTRSDALIEYLISLIIRRHSLTVLVEKSFDCRFVECRVSEVLLILCGHHMKSLPMKLSARCKAVRCPPLLGRVVLSPCV